MSAGTSATSGQSFQAGVAAELDRRVQELPRGSVVTLILTGNLQPSPVVVQQAEALTIPILLVPSSTMEAVERLEQAYSRTRLGQPEKLEAFMDLMKAHVDSRSIFAELGVD